VGFRGGEKINTVVLYSIWNVDLCSLYQTWDNTCMQP